ncbi:hypothetical protein [Stygiolobus sp. RP850M]|uniref:hypothetical protein n=1 Tax=Stygiolobus sp. RP850M TaxID=3133137 RepID=UPI00307EF0CD
MDKRDKIGDRMQSLRFYNGLSLLIYIIALTATYGVLLPSVDVLSYLISISLNFIPLINYNIRGVKIKDVKLIPSKHYLGLYVIKRKEISISSIAVDMPDVFLFIKYHEEGHSRQPFCLLYYLARKLSPFALALSIIIIPAAARKYKWLIRILASFQLVLFLLPFFGITAYDEVMLFFIVAFIALILSPVIEYIVTLLYFGLLYTLIIELITSLPVIFLDFANFLLIFKLLSLLLFYIGYTISSLAYEIDADTYAALKLKDRVLIAYQLFGKNKIRVKRRVSISTYLSLLAFTHPIAEYEYLRFIKIVKNMKNQDLSLHN